jgi:hypothetical protein
LKIWGLKGVSLESLDLSSAVWMLQNCCGASMCLRDNKGNFMGHKQFGHIVSSPLLYEVEAWKLIKANNNLVMKFGFF